MKMAGLTGQHPALARRGKAARFADPSPALIDKSDHLGRFFPAGAIWRANLGPEAVARFWRFGALGGKPKALRNRLAELFWPFLAALVGRIEKAPKQSRPFLSFPFLSFPFLSFPFLSFSFLFRRRFFHRGPRAMRALALRDRHETFCL